MDLICDPALVELTFKSSHSMRLKSNGGTMEVKKQAIMPGYHVHVWYNKKAITNILSLSNVIKQYRVMYDSNDQMFVVHREPEGKPDMEFRMHKSGLHYFDPRDSEFIFVNTVSENKQKLSILEGLQMDHSEQPDQGLSSNSRSRQHCTQNLGQECCGVERKDHSD
jgi:hypothetical protein